MTDSWPQQEVFSWLQQNGNVEQSEMLRTFNCGIGMVICLAEQDAAQATALLEAQGEQVFTIGRIRSAETEPPRVEYVQ